MKLRTITSVFVLFLASFRVGELSDMINVPRVVVFLLVSASLLDDGFNFRFWI